MTKVGVPVVRELQGAIKALSADRGIVGAPAHSQNQLSSLLPLIVQSWLAAATSFRWQLQYSPKNELLKHQLKTSLSLQNVQFADLQGSSGLRGVERTTVIGSLDVRAIQNVVVQDRLTNFKQVQFALEDQLLLIENVTSYVS